MASEIFADFILELIGDHGATDQLTGSRSLDTIFCGIRFLFAGLSAFVRGSLGGLRAGVTFVPPTYLQTQKEETKRRKLVEAFADLRRTEVW